MVPQQRVAEAAMMEMQDSLPLREENARLAAEVRELRERLAVRDGVVKALERTCLLLNTENLELLDAIEKARGEA